MQRGLIEAASRMPQLCILDLGLPDGDGMQLIRELRHWSSMPIVVLSARDRESDKIAALNAGADDYLTKPFGVGELLARGRTSPVLRGPDIPTNQMRIRFRLADLRDLHSITVGQINILSGIQY